MKKNFTEEELNNMMLNSMTLKSLFLTALILYGAYLQYLDEKYDLYSMDTSTWD